MHHISEKTPYWHSASVFVGERTFDSNKPGWFPPSAYMQTCQVLLTYPRSGAWGYKIAAQLFPHPSRVVVDHTNCVLVTHWLSSFVSDFQSCTIAIRSITTFYLGVPILDVIYQSGSLEQRRIFPDFFTRPVLPVITIVCGPKLPCWMESWMRVRPLLSFRGNSHVPDQMLHTCMQRYTLCCARTASASSDSVVGAGVGESCVGDTVGVIVGGSDWTVGPMVGDSGETVGPIVGADAVVGTTLPA